MCKIAMVLVLTSAFLAGCFDSEAEKIGDSVVEASKNLEEAGKAIAVSVPGERWARIVEGVTSADPAKREEVRQFAESLYTSITGAKLADRFEVTVNYGFDEVAGPVVTELFMGRAPDRSEVQAYCDTSSFVGTEARNTLSKPWSAAERTAAVQSKAAAFVEAMMVAAPDIASHPYMDLINKRNAESRDKAAKRLYALLESMYTTDTVPLTGTLLRTPFRPLEGKSVLFILMDEQMLKKHEEDASFRVVATAHEVKTGALFNERMPATFSYESFMQYAPVQCGPVRRPTRFVMLNYGESLTPEMVKAIQNLSFTVQALREYQLKQMRVNDEVRSTKTQGFFKKLFG